MKTLIVEDDAGTRALVKRIVQQSSKIVLEASNGLDALSIIEREDPDLVITDLRMPLLDGFELVAALRGSAAHTGVPVICLTSVGQREEIARLLESGITDYVLKPVKPAELTDRVKRALAAHANWRDERNQRINRDSGSSAILIIDPDETFRALAKAQLESDYEIILAGDAADGLRLYHERTVKPQTVFIAAKLPSLSEERAAALLKQIATADGATEPRVYTIIDHDDDDVRQPAIAGTIRRSFTPDEFTSRARAVLPAGKSPAERLRGVVLRDSNAWLVSVARHAFGVVTGKEVEMQQTARTVANAGAASAVRLTLTDSPVALVFRLACNADHAEALALEAAASSPGCDGPQLLGKLAAMIGCEVGTGLKSRGFVTLNPTPEPESADVVADLTIGIRAPGGQLLLLTGAVVEPSKEPAAA